MGNAQSEIRNKISYALPGLGEDSSFKLTGKSQKHFRDEQDRNQFIHAAISVLSDNGRLNLIQHDFRLLYSRRSNDEFRATLVAVKNGVIEAKVESSQDGQDQFEAFKAFKKHVEMKLSEVLQRVPESTAAGTSSSSSSNTPPNRASTLSPSDAPPSYDSSASKPAGLNGKKS